MGRPSNRDERRKQIVEAFLTVMGRHGYERATIAQIAQEAGLASGLVHYHFESKHEILLALMETLRESVRARVERRLCDAGTSGTERLRAFIDAHLALGDDADTRSVAAWVVIGTEALRDREVQRLYAEAAADTLEQLQKLVRAAAGKRLPPTRSRQIAAAILSMIEGAYRLSTGAPNLLPSGFAAPMVHRAIDGLLAEGGAS